VKGLAIAFTVWQDFRDCTSPHNTIWKGDYLKGDYWEDDYWDFVEAWRHVDFEVGSIKAGFEQVASSNVSNHLRTLPDMPVKGRGCFLNIE